MFWDTTIIRHNGGTEDEIAKAFSVAAFSTALATLVASQPRIPQDDSKTARRTRRGGHVGEHGVGRQVGKGAAVATLAASLHSLAPPAHQIGGGDIAVKDGGHALLAVGKLDDTTNILELDAIGEWVVARSRLALNRPTVRGD